MPKSQIMLNKDKDSAENPENPAEILIYDVIGFDWWTGGGVMSTDIIKQLEQIETEHLVVRINSPGGDVFEGFAIYEALRGFEGYVQVCVDSLAASAASFIAMAGDEIVMGEAAYMMIHDPWSGVIGTAEDMRKEADLLDKITGTIAELYAKRAEGDLEEIKKLMQDETWMTADEAVELGFADRKKEGKQTKAQAFDLSKFNYRKVPNALRREGHKGIPSRRDMERKLMQDAGLSRSQARALLSNGYNALSGTQDAALEGDQSLEDTIKMVRSAIAIINP
jgi:ATP-dependent Clp endopeptidase proteolytic subunit ClpP